jgi:predicted phosphoribosyltransferase
MTNINQNNKIFENREAAAVLLVNELKKIIDKKDYPITVLAIPRGGIVLGDIIATSLNVKLDIIISKKIGSPDNNELAIGAVTHDGSFFPNEDIIEKLDISQEYIKKQISNKVKEIEIRLNKFRGDDSYDLKNNTIILVDDGIATGATTFAAIKWLRNQNTKKIILAVPVAPRDTANLISKLVDKTIILSTPLIFFAVGEFYQNFSEVTDNQVLDIMSKYRWK